MLLGVATTTTREKGTRRTVDVGAGVGGQGSCMSEPGARKGFWDRPDTSWGMTMQGGSPGWNRKAKQANQKAEAV